MRLYKTGDLGRYRADGNIEFLGRIDRQVKVRGFRIELGEVEAVLRQHGAVVEAAALAREDAPGEKRLVAYVVPSNESQVTSNEFESKPDSSLVSEVRVFLKEKLPEYMVPSVFVLLEALPLTPNGKLDRGALPLPDEGDARRAGWFVAPRDTIELQLARIWEDLLGVRRIGVADNFFDLGGHSLLAVRLMVRIEQVFGRRLPVASLFQEATIEHIARRLRHESDPAPWSPVVVIQAGDARRPFFCAHPGSGSALDYLELARSLGPDQPFYGLQAAGLEGEREPYSRVPDMAARYVEAMRAVQPQGPYLLGGWSIGGVIAFEIARQLRQQGHEVALLALLDSVAPSRDPQDGCVDDAYLLASFLRDLVGSTGQAFALSPEIVEQHEPDQRLRYVLDRARALNIVPPDIGIAEVGYRLAVFKANLQAVRSYVPEVASGRLTLFRAQEHASERLADPTMGWGALVDGPIELIDIPGNHYTIVKPPHVQALAEQLNARLAAAQAIEGAANDPDDVGTRRHDFAPAG